MTAVVVVAHAPLASALGAVARHVYSDCQADFAAVDIAQQMAAEDAEAAIRQAVVAYGQREVLLLADVFGATPCNAAARLADGLRVRLVAGVNVPLLWRALCDRHEPVDALVVRLTSNAAHGILQVSSVKPQNQVLPTRPPHDQESSHHQQ